MNIKKVIFIASLLITFRTIGQAQTSVPLDTLFAQDIREVKLNHSNLLLKGIAQLDKFQEQNVDLIGRKVPIVYPEKAMQKGTQGTVYARFLIDTLGAITDIKIISGLGDGCTEEVLRVLNKLAETKYSPAILDGSKMTAYQIIYIKFVLE